MKCVDAQVKFLQGHLLPTMNKHYDKLGLEDPRTKSLKYAVSKLAEDLARNCDGTSANGANGGGRQRRPPVRVWVGRLQRQAVQAPYKCQSFLSTLASVAKRMAFL